MPAPDPGRAAVPALAAALDDGARALGVGLDGARRERLLAYLDLLVRWNRVYNLTAVRDARDMVPVHLLDCLSVTPYVRGRRVLDIGTGAGLPGLVIAIVDPARECVLVDAVAKKTRFCRQAAAELGLDNVEVVHARVEQIAPGARFDTVTARALASLAELAALALGRLAPGGRVLAMKGRRPDDELAALDGIDARCHALDVPGVTGQRHLVVMRRPERPA